MAKKTVTTAESPAEVKNDDIRNLMIDGKFTEAEDKIKKLTKAKRKNRSTEIEQLLLNAKLTHNEYLLLNTELQIINDNL